MALDSERCDEAEALRIAATLERRSDAGATLRAAGVSELVMLTGDAEAPARRIADELGVGYRARLLPDQKVEAVRELVSEYGDVGMVGDGVNDAPALADMGTSIAVTLNGLRLFNRKRA